MENLLKRILGKKKVKYEIEMLIQYIDSLSTKELEINACPISIIFNPSEPFSNNLNVGIGENDSCLQTKLSIIDNHHRCIFNETFRFIQTFYYVAGDKSANKNNKNNSNNSIPSHHRSRSVGFTEEKEENKNNSLGIGPGPGEGIIIDDLSSSFSVIISKPSKALDPNQKNYKFLFFSNFSLNHFIDSTNGFAQEVTKIFPLTPVNHSSQNFFQKSPRTLDNNNINNNIDSNNNPYISVTIKSNRCNPFTYNYGPEHFINLNTTCINKNKNNAIQNPSDSKRNSINNNNNSSGNSSNVNNNTNSNKSNNNNSNKLAPPSPLFSPNRKENDKINSFVNFEVSSTPTLLDARTPTSINDSSRSGTMKLDLKDFLKESNSLDIPLLKTSSSDKDNINDNDKPVTVEDDSYEPLARVVSDAFQLAMKKNNNTLVDFDRALSDSFTRKSFELSPSCGDSNSRSFDYDEPLLSPQLHNNNNHHNNKYKWNKTENDHSHDIDTNKNVGTRSQSQSISKGSTININNGINNNTPNPMSLMEIKLNSNLSTARSNHEGLDHLLDEIDQSRINRGRNID